MRLSSQEPGKFSVMNQVLRQCKFRKNAAQRDNYTFAISKKRAMGSLVKDIRNYANLSSIERDANGVNASQEIPYLSQRSTKLNLHRFTDGALTQQKDRELPLLNGTRRLVATSMDMINSGDVVLQTMQN